MYNNFFEIWLYRFFQKSMKNEFRVYVPSPWPQPWPDCSLPHILTPGGARTGAWRASTPVRTQGIDSETTSREVNDSALNCSEISTAWSVYFFLHCCLVSVTSSVSTRVRTERKNKAPSPCILLDCRSNMRGRGATWLPSSVCVSDHL